MPVGRRSSGREEGTPTTAWDGWGHGGSAGFCRHRPNRLVMDLEIDLVLAAVDSSDEAVDAAQYAIAVAERYDADLHVLHVLDQRVMHGVETGDVAAESVAEEQRAVTGRLRRECPGTVTLSHSGAVGFSPSRLGQTPGSIVLDAADELEADFLVVPRVNATGNTDEVLGKAALHVLEYASQPVLSV